jgi:hypothetical protein
MSDDEMNIDEGVSITIFLFINNLTFLFKLPTEEAQSGREVVVFKVLRVCLFVLYGALYPCSDAKHAPQVATKVALPQSRLMTELNPRRCEMWIPEPHDVGILALYQLRARF